MRSRRWPSRTPCRAPFPPFRERRAHGSVRRDARGGDPSLRRCRPRTPPRRDASPLSALFPLALLWGRGRPRAPRSGRVSRPASRTEPAAPRARPLRHVDDLGRHRAPRLVRGPRLFRPPPTRDRPFRRRRHKLRRALDRPVGAPAPRRGARHLRGRDRLRLAAFATRARGRRGRGACARRLRGRARAACGPDARDGAASLLLARVSCASPSAAGGTHGAASSVPAPLDRGALRCGRRRSPSAAPCGRAPRAGGRQGEHRVRPSGRVCVPESSARGAACPDSPRSSTISRAAGFGPPAPTVPGRTPPRASSPCGTASSPRRGGSS